MKQLIIDKIDRLVEQGYEIVDIKSGLRIGEILVTSDSEFFPTFTVHKSGLTPTESEEIYRYIYEKRKQQFIEYLKGD